MVERQVLPAAAVDAGPRVLAFLYVLPDRRGPGNLARGEPLEPVHDEAVLPLTRTGRLGDDLGILPEDQVTYRPDS